MGVMRADTVIVIDNIGTFNVENYEQVPTEFRMNQSDGAMRPDPKWDFTDKNGHSHTWNLDYDTIITYAPTISQAVKRRETVRCDDSCGNYDCEGYPHIAWNCRLCGALIKPGYVADYSSRTGTPIMIMPGYMILTVSSNGSMYGKIKRLDGVSAVVYGHGNTIHGTVYPFDDLVTTYSRAGERWRHHKLRFDYANK